MLKTLIFFKLHHLEISVNKTKIMVKDGPENIVFYGTDDLGPVAFEAVCKFKYLGITLDTSARCFVKEFNENVKRKAERYFYSVLSLSRTGPDRTKVAYTLWTACALPSILHGAEIMPISETTLSALERLNAQVGKFILQIPRSSANSTALIDAGLKPVWAVIAERTLLYAKSLMNKPKGYWPKIALTDNLQEGLKSHYTSYLTKWMSLCHTSLTTKQSIKKSVLRASINSIKKQNSKTQLTCFAMNLPDSSKQKWFSPRTWVCDSINSKTIPLL